MSELEPKSRALFRSARAEMAPSAADRARVESALAMKIASIGAGAGAGGAAGAAGAAGSIAKAAKVGGATAGAAKVGASMVAAKWLVAVAIVGSVGAGSATWLASTRPAPRSAPATTPTSRPVEPPAAMAAPTTTPLAPEPPPPVALATPEKHGRVVRTVAPPEESPPSSAPASSAVAVASSPSAHVSAEARLLRDAQAALGSGDAARALSLLEQHATSFPSGVLGQERRAERVLALCGLGREAQAKDEGARFLQQNPESPLAPRIRASCAGR